MTAPRFHPSMTDGLVDWMTLLRQVQRFLVPFLTESEIDERVRACFEEAPDTTSEESFEALAILNALLYDHPPFFEDVASRVIDREVALLEQIERGDLSSSRRRYRLRQIHRIPMDGLPERCALHLSLPAPRAIEGVQNVRLSRCAPASLADYYLPEAGLVHDVCVVLGLGEPVPVLELEYEVEQDLRGLMHLRDDRLGGIHPPEPIVPAPVLAEWRERVQAAASSDGAPDHAVAGLLDAMEDQFQFGITGTPHDTLLEMLPQVRVGSIETLSRFASEVLRSLGFAVRLGGGQELFFAPGEDRTTLTLPGSSGYEDRFVYWKHLTSGTTGTFDLSYFRRWHVAATEYNTRAAEFREKLEAVGRRGKAWLRAGVYPLDVIVSGHPRSTVVVDFDGSTTFDAPAAVDTEIIAERTIANEARS
jgi:hypothetical protein